MVVMNNEILFYLWRLCYLKKNIETMILTSVMSIVDI